MSDGLGHRRQGRDRSPHPHGAGPLPLASSGRHVDDLAAGYALGALEPAERLHVERHRRMCPACDRLLVEESRVVGLLPFAVPATQPPPPDVKPALLARVGHVIRAAADLPAHRVASASAPTPTLPASRPIAQPTDAPSLRGIPGPDTRSRRWNHWTSVLLALPLLLALGATTAWAIQLRAQAEERGERANSIGAVVERALADDGTVYQLEPGPAAPEAKGWVVADPGQTSATIYVKGDETRSGERFELSASGEGTPSTLAQVELDERGRGVKTFPLERPLSAFRSLKVKPLTPRGDGTEAIGLALWGHVDDGVSPPTKQGAPAATVATDPAP